jgi:hypothetical protein
MASKTLTTTNHQPSTCTHAGGPWFNLFNLGGKSEAEMKKLKLNEIKNGRLAMLAVFGYGAQVRHVTLGHG